MSTRTERTVTIHLMDCFTGQTATCSWVEGWHPDKRSPHWTADYALAYGWTEGNWSCDCNRYREWLLATRPHLNHQEREAAEEGNDICGEPRIRARYQEGTEPFDDWPADEVERLVMAARIRESRKGLETCR